MTIAAAEMPPLIWPPASVLLIVGNGFDMHHGIKSGYSHFVAQVKELDRDLFRKMEEYLPGLEEEWWNLEAALGEPDVDQMIDYAAGFLMSYGDENWSDSGHHDYQYELEQIAEGLSGRLLQRFTQWIYGLSIPEQPQPHLVDLLAPQHLYFSFNYTSTLESIYRIPVERVLHIHGSTMDRTSPLVLGHDYDEMTSRNDYPGIEEEDTRVIEGNHIIDDYFKDTFKPAAALIEKNQGFFESLRRVKTVYVLGHSLSSVDVPYLQAISENLGQPAQWIVAVRSLDEVEEKLARLIEIGVSNRAIMAVLWEQLILQ